MFKYLRDKTFSESNFVTEKCKIIFTLFFPPIFFFLHTQATIKLPKKVASGPPLGIPILVSPSSDIVPPAKTDSTLFSFPED